MTLSNHVFVEVHVTDILQLSVREFIANTAAKQPTPGGGSVAALCGALAASLAAMALRYTAGKKAFAAHDAEIREALAQFQRAADMLQELMVEDVAAYDSLSALLKLPEPERLQHPNYTATVVAAIRTPQAAGGFAMNVLQRCVTLLDKTNKMLLSDLGIAAVYAHATVHASEMNVLVNLPLLPQREEAAGVRRELAELSAKADRLYADVRMEILRRL
jgi:formiminotetrahydrofolate cyclodeaminase